MIRVHRIKLLVLFSFICSLMFPFLQQGVEAASTIIVTSKSNHNPGYIWCQRSDGTWSTSSTIDGNVSSPNDNGQPQKKKVRTYANISAPTDNWEDSIGNAVIYSKVKNIQPISIPGESPVMSAFSDPDIQGDPTIVNKQVIIEGFSGNGVDGTRDDSLCGGNPGYNYAFPVTVTWQGEIDPPQGTIHINYFTDAGASLSGVFPSETRTMEQGSNQSFSHKTNAGFNYLGYKKSSVAQPSGGTIVAGDPPSITYDGTYTDYWVSYYYHANVPVPDPEPEPDPEPQPDPDPNQPPVAVIMAPSEVRMGDMFTPSGYGSYDPDGTIAQYYWGTVGATGTITGGSGPIYYTSTGERRITLAVEDNEGAANGTEKTINVILPYVYAQMTVGGTKKENRKVTLTSSTDSPSMYPVVETKWTITAISGGTSNDIKIKGALTQASIETLFKKAGKYKVSFYARNSAGYTDTEETILEIDPDLQPVSQFSVPTWIYRNPADSNFALMDIKDTSKSNDGDPIKSHILTISYNGNNNYYSNSIVVDVNDPEPGLKAKTIYSKFDDDPFLDINILTMNVNQTYSFTTNGITITALKKTDGTLQLKSKHVGRYLLEIRTTEDFGQPTIPEFITASDYRSNSTASKPLLEKVLTIDNRAPTVNFKP